MSQIQKTLGEIMRRLQVSQNRRLTYRDLAKMAGASERTVSEWMRGATSPMAMNGLLNLMSALKADDAIQVLSLWRETAPQDPTSVNGGEKARNSGAALFPGPKNALTPRRSDAP